MQSKGDPMTRSFRKSLGLVATAALLSGCAMTPQPETVTLPNPLAVFNGVLTAPTAPAYAGVPSYTQQSVPASYGSYAPAAPVYGALDQSYSSANGVFINPNSSIESASYSTTTIAPSYNSVTTAAPAYSAPLSYAAPAPVTTTLSAPVQSYSTSSIPTLGTLAPAAPSYSVPAPMAAPSYSVPAPVASSYSMPVPAPAVASYSAPAAVSSSYSVAAPVVDSMSYALPAPQAASYATSVPTLGSSSVVQSAPLGTSYDLTTGLGAPSMGGSFGVIEPITTLGY